MYTHTIATVTAALIVSASYPLRAGEEGKKITIERLCDAASNGDIDNVIRYVKTIKICVDSINSIGNTALATAAGSNHPEACKIAGFLIKHGASMVKGKDHPFEIALAHESYPMCRLLIANGALLSMDHESRLLDHAKRVEKEYESLGRQKYLDSSHAYSREQYRAMHANMRSIRKLIQEFIPYESCFR